MIAVNIRTRGIESAMSALLKIPGFVSLGIQDVAKTARLLAEGATPVGVGSGAGTSKRSWGQVEREASGFSFTNPLGHMGVLEDGLYPSVGPRTVASGGGVYSRQAPGGILTPLIEDDATLTKIAELVADQIERALR